MPTIEQGTYIRRYAFWNPETWSIPAMYWDTFSQEQRIHAICRELSKVIQYADYIGVNTDDIAARLKAIEDGQLDEFITAAIEQWFEDNEPEIMQALSDLDNKMNDVYDFIPMSDFDSTNTVKKYIDDAASEISSDISDLGALLPSTDFTSASTVKDAIDAVANDVSDLGAIIPDSEFSAASTVKDAIDAVASDVSDIQARFPVVTADIANNAVTTAKIANGSITKEKESKKKILFFGDSWVSPDHNWTFDLADELNMTPTNYAQGGMGWAYGNNNIETQVDNATADNEVDIIIAIGGINDVIFSISYDTYIAAVISTCVKLRNKFPKAKIYVCPLNVPAKAYAFTATAIDNYYYRAFTDTALQSSGVALFDMIGWYQPLAPFGIWTIDNLHLSLFGEAILREFLYGTINGSYMRSTICSFPIYDAANVTSFGKGLTIANGRVQFDVRGWTIPTVTNGSTITLGQFAFDANNTPWYARYTIQDEFFPCISGYDGAYVGRIALNEDGSVKFTAWPNDVSGNILPAPHSWDIA